MRPVNDRLRLLTRHTLQIASLGALLAVLFGRSLGEHMRRATEPLLFNDDARQQIFEFYRNVDPDLFPHDTIGDYYLASFPLGYRALYAWLAPLVDPSVLSKVVPYILLAVTGLGVVLAARELGGLSAALGSAAMLLSTGIFFDRMVGGLPRSFAFPLLALALFALVAGRAYMLALLVVVAALFYPPAGALCGIALAILLIAVPARDRGCASSWSLPRRFLVLTATAVAAVLLLVPPVVSLRSYGRTLTPSDAATFPELGPGGRYGPDDRPPFPDLVTAAIVPARRALVGAGEPILPPARAWTQARGAAHVADVMLAVLLAGLLALCVEAGRGRRAVVLGLAVALGYVAARLVPPFFYLPQRYVAYAVPVAVLTLLPAGGAALAGLIFRRRAMHVGRPLGAILVALCCLVALGGRGTTSAGFTVDARPGKRLYAFLSSLPKDVLVAGFPGGPVDNVPYVARRTALLTYETHQAFHEKYALEMRRRMRIFVAAYFASDPHDLTRLRDELGVTHLIVDAAHFTRRPGYIKPLDDDVRVAYEKGRRAGFALQTLLPSAVFSEANLAVIDLSRVGAR